MCVLFATTPLSEIYNIRAGLVTRDLERITVEKTPSYSIEYQEVFSQGFPINPWSLNQLESRFSD